MDLGLSGKVALVSGASRGIGRGIALALAREGCDVALVARGAAELAAARDEVAALGVRALAISDDVAAPGGAERIAAAAAEGLGAVDVLVNNVGGNRRKPFLDTTDEDWTELLDLNLQAHVRLTRAIAPGMRDRRRGAIVFVSSVFGREAGGPGLSIYNTTKSALISLAKILALELAPHGVRVNSVAPGSIRFPGGSWDKRALADPEGIAKFVERELPLGRFGTVEEVADVVAFLCSERAGLVTGACVAVDGSQGRSLI